MPYTIKQTTYSPTDHSFTPQISKLRCLPYLRPFVNKKKTAIRVLHSFALSSSLSLFFLIQAQHFSLTFPAAKRWANQFRLWSYTVYVVLPQTKSTTKYYIVFPRQSRTGWEISGRKVFRDFGPSAGMLWSGFRSCATIG